MYSDIDWHDVSIDELSEETQEIAQVIGLEATAKLMRQFGGRQIYVMSPRPIISRRIHETIQREYDGTNADDLCRRLGISRRQLSYALNS